MRDPIDSITEPKTPEDFVLAINDKDSILHLKEQNKKENNLFNFRLSIEKTLHELIQRYLNAEYIATENEKDEIVRKYHERNHPAKLEAMIKTDTKALPQHIIFEEVNRQNSDALLLLYTKCRDNLTRLRTQRDNLEIRRENVTREEANNLHDWEQQTEQAITGFREFVADHPIHVMNDQGEFVPVEHGSPAETAIIENALRLRPTPAALIRAFSSIPEEEERATTTVRIPPPPPPLPAHLPQVMAINDAFRIAISTIQSHRELSEGHQGPDLTSWGPFILQTMRQNSVHMGYFNKPVDTKCIEKQHAIEHTNYGINLEDLALPLAEMEEKRQMNLCSAQYAKLNRGVSIEEVLKQAQANEALGQKHTGITPNTK